MLPEYKGKGIAKIAEDLLVRKHKISKLYATIDKNNIASIKSHLKLGFIYESEGELIKLRKNGYLKHKQVRLYKLY